jgi:hypothetical protein
VTRNGSRRRTGGRTAFCRTGNYTYDGAGNIESIGSSTFLYDKVSRLTSGTVK